jgi:hypothetical protein
MILRNKRVLSSSAFYPDAEFFNRGAAESQLGGCLKPDYGTGLQPFISCFDYFLGLCPRLIWLAPLALSNIWFRISLSAEGAASYQPGAEPQE